MVNILILFPFLEKSKNIIVGVSGGPDSLCLLDLLIQNNFKAIICHVNHCLRKEAYQEEQRIKEIGETYGVPYNIKRIDVLGISRSRSLSIEEAGRIERYRFLYSQAIIYDAQAVAVGHTADDQVETILMHFLRGSGLSGLQGMRRLTVSTQWSEDIPLIRPLLSLWRDEIISYCRAQGLNPVDDPSNLSNAFFRNRLRNELMPVLETYVPGLKKRLWRMGDVIQGDTVVLEDIVDQAWGECLQEVGKGYIVFMYSAFKEKRLSVQRRILLRGLKELKIKQGTIGYDAVEQTRKFISHPTRSSMQQISSGFTVRMEEGKIILMRKGAELSADKWPQLDKEKMLVVEVPDRVLLEDGWQFEAVYWNDVKGAYRRAQKNHDPFEAWLDLGEDKIMLSLRTRRPGDRFLPFGMDGHSIKVSDFMINVKIPRRARRKWPLICLGDMILWVPGFRVADSYRISDTTRRVVYIKFDPPA